jgi:hypothetical protein
MPRYYFHTLHGRPFRDLEGDHFVGPAEARRAAVRIMGELLKDGATDFWDAGPFSVVCEDEQGGVVTGLTARRIPDEEAGAILRQVKSARD